MAKRHIGIDYIIGGEYERVVVRHHPEGWAAGFLWNVSDVKGSAKVIRNLAATGKCPRIRVSLLWSDTHSFSKSDISKVKKRAAKLAKIINDYPNVKWFVQPFLEPHRVGKNLMQAAFKAVRSEVPLTTKLVTGNSHGARTVVREVHHSTTSWQGTKIFSLDGKDYRETNVRLWLNKTATYNMFFYWSSNCNGNKQGQKLPRKLRTNWLTKDHIADIVRTHNKAT